MKFCDVSFPTPEENLACDESLLDLCEDGHSEELLRFWEAAQYFVVVGYSNKVSDEVHQAFCELNGIPVLRRCTGGGTILQGAGVLNYSLVLRSEGSFDTISGTNDFILKKNRDALTRLLNAPVEIQGHTDLAIGGLKFCGNAQRRKKHFLLFHGSFLLHLDVDLVEKALPLPSKQPEYRLNRSHGDFLMNLKMPPEMVKTALREAWGACEQWSALPLARVVSLVREKYGLPEWNLKF